MRLIIKDIKRWLLMLIASFFLYELLWYVIEMQLGTLKFDWKGILWDFLQCALFTSVFFIVNYFFVRYKNGRYAQSIIEVGCLLIVNALIIFLTDKILYVQGRHGDNFWDVIDIYVICIICSMFSIINIQQAYHKKFVAFKEEQIKLRLKLLQQQLSPHFMFNSLSVLQGMIAVDTKKAEEYVVTLSDILRYITENIDKEKVALHDALNYIESYVQMLDMRFPKHFLFNIDMNNMPYDTYIVPVSLQIAVENVIKHNNHSQKSPLEISISVGDKTVEVKNRKQPVAFADSLGIGLKNLGERYTLLTGRGIDICETNDYYTVKMPLIYESTNNRR